MKILVFTDNHFCEVASIIRKFGIKYSVRLENQLESLNWLEELAVSAGCQAVICGGDFFNTPNLSEKEITAARDIKWNGMPHYFIVGNHESGESNLQYSSTKLLEGENRQVLSQACKTAINDTELCFLPYVLESDRKPLENYFGKQTTKKRVIFSHNDLKGIQMGMVESQSGFTIEEIESNCDLFVNGHLHNGTKVTDKIINLGSLTGQNFGENAAIYPHNIMILDTDTLQYELIENPFAINFYKFEVMTKKDLSKLMNLKNNAVLSIKCIESLMVDVTAGLEQQNSKILESRIVPIKATVDADNNVKYEELTLDHLAKLYEFCKERLGATTIVEQELAEICK